MRGIHPQLAGRALAWLALLGGFAGCQGNRQTASINPFFSPDRVPPPATRTVLPGTAQPYYPGDPLPSMQSAASASVPQATPVTNVTIAQTATTSASSSSSDGAKLAYSNERLVSIPTDNGALRFEQPPPTDEPAPFTPAANSAPIAAEHVAAPTSATHSAHGVPGSISPPSPEAAPSVAANFITPTSPWRKPQVSNQVQPSISASARDVIQASMVQPAGSLWNGVPAASHPQRSTMSPIAAAPSTMDVRLRAVASPAAAAVGTPAPRIRIPSRVPATQTFVMPDGSIQEVTYTPVETPHVGGTLQTVAITPLTSPLYSTDVAAPQLASTSAGQSSESLANRDGFRPRGSTRSYGRGRALAAN